MTKDIKMVLHYGDETHTIQGHELHHNMILRAITDAYKAQGDRWGVAFFRKLSALNSLVHAPEDSAVTAHYFEEAVTNGLEEIKAPKIFYELRADEMPKHAPYPKG
mgnify:CR=1 FL=1